ncbi:MAG TPA: hypothetical protein VGA95_06695 [Thermodesulfobacteriota bacterium]|jgi:hypothetical protein
MRTIIITFILGLALGIVGCSQKDEPIEDDKEIVVDDNTDNSEEEETKDEDEKHIDDPADILQDLTF